MGSHNLPAPTIGSWSLLSISFSSDNYQVCNTGGCFNAVVNPAKRFSTLSNLLVGENEDDVSIKYFGALSMLGVSLNFDEIYWPSKGRINMIEPALLYFTFTGQ